MTHELKCWPSFFQVTWFGYKRFEIRDNDRKFQVGDEIVLREWDDIAGKFTGRQIFSVITYLTDFEQRRGFVVFEHREHGRKNG